MSEPTFNLEAAEQQYNQVRADNAEEVQEQLPLREELPVVEVEEIDEELIDDLPPGFKPFDEYVEEGGDPDMYRGKKAYENEHDRIQENRALKREMKGLHSTVQQTVEATNEILTNERTKMKRELEAELHTAKENEDVPAALEAQKGLDELDVRPAATPPENTEPPVITDFREKNPMIDTESAQFDEEFNEAVEGFYNETYNRLTQNGRKGISDAQINRCLQKAMREARDLHQLNDEPEEPAPTESPRNTRKRGQQRPRRQQQTRQPITARAEDFKIENPKNGRDTSGADVRNMIRDKAYKSARKGGKTEADATIYAEQETKRFEESLAR